MIHQHDLSEKNNLEISRAFKALKINKILRFANIRKSEGFSAAYLFQLLIILVFENKNLYRLLDSAKGKDRPQKDSYYRFLKQPTFAWRRFLAALSLNVIQSFTGLTSDKRVKVLIVDDSLFSRSRSKKVELLARVFDHVTGKMVKGFSMLTLGWSDGHSFVPVDFDMLSSVQDKLRLSEIDERIDKRTHGFKRRQDALQQRPDSVYKMVKSALESGILADYILMDSWFTNEPMIKRMLDFDLDVIGMVKNQKQRYEFGGVWYSLPELRGKLKASDFNDVIGQIHVKTKSGIKVKLVFIKNRNKRKEWLALLCTDMAITAAEVVRIYGMRWDIEVFFKASKSLLKLAKEFQGRSFDMTIAHTTIVFTRFIILQWIHRQHTDHRTFGELFYDFCDEVKQVDFVDSLKSLLEIISEIKNSVSQQANKLVLRLLDNWIQTQPSHIRHLLGLLVCES
ncbi:transposase [Dehalobacter sp. TBBPA1]|uniref:IS4 family transposase n=1 Tax=Dehalobacter sp. TBBPA1 TaxID=3235037 RepID=UPI0034A1E9A8